MAVNWRISSFLQSSSYEHIGDQSLTMEPFIKPAASQPILPLATSSNSIPSDEESKEMRRRLHEMGYHRDKERMLTESAKRDLEKEKQITAQLKVLLYHNLGKHD